MSCVAVVTNTAPVEVAEPVGATITPVERDVVLLVMDSTRAGSAKGWTT